MFYLNQAYFNDIHNVLHCGYADIFPKLQIRNQDDIKSKLALIYEKPVSGT